MNKHLVVVSYVVAATHISYTHEEFFANKKEEEETWWEKSI